jgi:hypothetical protein
VVARQSRFVLAETRIVSEESEVRDRAWQVTLAALGYRLAHVGAFQCDKLIGVLFDEIGEAVQVGAPFVRSHARPWAFVEGNPRGPHRPGGVLCGSAGDSRPGLLGGGVDRVKPLVGRDRFTVDEVGQFIHVQFGFQLEASRVIAAATVSRRSATAGAALDRSCERACAPIAPISSTTSPTAAAMPSHGDGEARCQSDCRRDLEDADATPQPWTDAKSVADLYGLFGAGELGRA